MRNSTLFLHVPLQEKIVFTKNLALTLKAGVSLVNSLRLLRNQTKSKSLQKILESLMSDANRGVFLSDALVRYQSVFGNLFVNIIRIAETSGTLPENLLYLGEELRKKHELRKKVRGAMVYPVIILIATVIIAAGMTIFVFPKLTPLFASLGANLPFTTKLLLAISKTLSSYGLWIFLGAILAFVGFRFSLKLKPIRYYLDITLLYVPLLGGVITNYNMANLSRTLGLLLRSGVKIIEAIKITSDATVNSVYQKSLTDAAEVVRRGEFFSKYLSEHPKRYPTILVNMTEIGENTGNLTENLFYLDDYYEGEVDDFLKNISSVIEPVLLLVMGAIVAFIALSFITPIYQLTRSIK
jgi:type IV pilus assembly protein PilC